MGNRYVHPEAIEEALLPATFGRGTHDEAKIRSYYGVWNNLLRRMHVQQCWYKPERPKSGCKLPMCPMCALAARRRILRGVLKWHWKTPMAKMSIFETCIISGSPADVFELFEPRIQRATQARGRSGMLTVGSIVTTAYSGVFKLPDHMVYESEKPSSSRWIHRRLTVLWHDEASDVPRLRGPKPVADVSMMMYSTHYHLDDICDDGSVWRRWVGDPSHIGKVIVGGLLARFDNISGYLRYGGAPATDFVGMLRSAGNRRKWCRVNNLG